jgi:hypothetical protein
MSKHEMVVGGSSVTFLRLIGTVGNAASRLPPSRNAPDYEHR